MILAYLDPGSGSLILQAVLGGAAGLGVAAKAMRSRWRRRKEGTDGEAEESTVEEEPASAETGEA
jgi:hypothetical protein